MEGATDAVQILNDYQLVREDVDSIMEISIWGNQPDPYSKLDSKVSGGGDYVAKIQNKTYKPANLRLGCLIFDQSSFFPFSLIN